jgi:sRNA-binding carbon storage regulator CsrA
MLVLSRKLKHKIPTVNSAVNSKGRLVRLASDTPPKIPAPREEARARVAESRARAAAEVKQDKFKRQLSAWLKTTGMGLGLLRLQLDAGLFEEARAAVACIQNDFQLLRHGVEGETESLSPKRSLSPAALLRDHEPELGDSFCGV